MPNCARRLRPALAGAALLLCAIPAAWPSDAPAERLRLLAAAVQPAELHASVEALVGFGTRHTMSDTRSDTRGIGAARRWVQRRFEAISAQCGQCLEVLSRHRFRATIVYAALSGEEQGLYGGQVLAAFARQQGWRVEADLNDDIIGNSHGQDGVHDNTTVRVFSEGTKATETPAQANRRRYNGGEVDSPSRNLARTMAALAENHLTNLRVEMVYRTDRYGRGGDQVPFLEQGFPAVRVTEAHEDYTHQHQDLRTEGGVHYGDTIEFMDFDYLAQVTRLNVITLAALADAPAPPAGVAIGGAVTPDTTLSWQPVPGAAAYRVWWRRTTDPQWRHSRLVPADAQPPNRLTLKNLVIDDWFFGVSAVSADGHESPVVFPGDAGAF